MPENRNGAAERQLRAVRRAEAAGERPPDLPEPRWPGRRGAVRAASSLTAVCGLVVAVSPLVATYDGDFWRWNAVAAGVTVALLGLARATGLYSSPAASYLNGALGAWIFASSFLLDGSGGARAITGVFGFLVAGFALVSAAYGNRDSIASSSG